MAGGCQHGRPCCSPAAQPPARLPAAHAFASGTWLIHSRHPLHEAANWGPPTRFLSRCNFNAHVAEKTNLVVVVGRRLCFCASCCLQPFAAQPVGIYAVPAAVVEWASTQSRRHGTGRRRLGTHGGSQPHFQGHTGPKRPGGGCRMHSRSHPRPQVRSPVATTAGSRPQGPAHLCARPGMPPTLADPNSPEPCSPTFFLLIQPALPKAPPVAAATFNTAL